MKIIRFICLAAIAAQLFASPAQARNDPVKAMWVWDYYASVHTPEQREELIRFSLRQDMNVLFVGTKRTLSEHQPAYADLIERAHANGIRVFALAGEAAWALEENHDDALAQIDHVLDYNAEYPSSKFDGIQLDIEPYTLKEYSEDADEIGAQFLRLLTAAERIVPDELELNAAIPFWYATSGRPTIVEYGDASKPLSRHILDIVDSVSIMAYRDRAEDQIRLSLNDIEYAASAGKKAYVASETLPPDGEKIPDRITYRNEKVSYMNVQLEAIERYYGDHPGFGGVAVHAYDSFQEMLRNEERRMERQFAELQAAGILTGYPDGGIGFGKPTTRAEVAAIAARIGGYTKESLYRPASASFRDVSERQWFYGWVESANRMGVMEGKGNRTFDPNSRITVEEALLVMAKSAGLAEAENTKVPGASAWAQGWIQALLAEGIVDRRYSYTYQIAREDLIDIVYKTLQRLGKI